MENLPTLGQYFQKLEQEYVQKSTLFLSATPMMENLQLQPNKR